MKKFTIISIILTLLCFVGTGFAADIVPDVIMMPGTQPGEVSLESIGRCLNCHKNYEVNPRVEPGFGWMGSAMGNAGRDPIFWATLAVAEQDFDGAGDLCIRCHSAGGWVAGRSTPTDASGLQASDDNGIDCETCHQMTDPDMQVVDPISGVSIIGTMTDPFINNENDSLDPALAGEGYYGSGMYALSNDYGKLGPYNEGDAVARHQFTGSDFHRDVDFCGTCHDVSNSAVGQLAPNAGTLSLSPNPPDVQRSGHLGYPLQVLADPNDPNVPNDPAVLELMAAFENPPYEYGIVERTFSEYKSSPFPTTLVDEFYTKLPADLQDPRGSLYNAYTAAFRPADGTANYEDGDLRYFSCQTCHMRAITGRGCDKNDAPNRQDQPMHDHTGGNYWVYPLVQWQDNNTFLRMGGGLDAEQIEAMDDGMVRASQHLKEAGTLDVNGDIVRITNMTGHKLITGYPEGRRMWVNIKWFDNADVEMTAEEVGAWGELPIAPITNPVRPAQTFVPKSIVNPDDTRLKVYEVLPAMTQDWAQKLLVVDSLLGAPVYASKDLGFDRITGESIGTIADLAAGTFGPYIKTFHFALNNYIASDNRIPAYQMDYDEALRRNASPVPHSQYGGAPGGKYQHWDEFDIKAIAPSGAKRAELTLYYQGTSWEYVQFLWLESNCTDPNDPNQTAACGAFLGLEGVNYLDAWINAVNTVPGLMDAEGTMVPPYPMATAVWHDAVEPQPEICDDTIDNDLDGMIDCNDPDCTGDPACPELIEWPDCFDGLDNDQDGLTDCADTTDCQGETQASTCGVGECAATGTQTCLSNGTLDDTCVPGTPTPEVCTGGLDEDCDGLTDCADPDCNADPACQMQCADYLDKGTCNNDPNCEWQGNPKNGMCIDAAVCTPTGPETGNCNDGIDNDCNGLTDCADTAVCGDDPACMMACDTYGDKMSCQNAGCTWSNKDKVCM